MPTPVFPAVVSPATFHRPGVITDGQTVFTLPSTPVDATTIEFIVNGVSHSPVDVPANITVAGTVITWLDALHPIAASDEVRIQYF